MKFFLFITCFCFLLSTENKEILTYDAEFKNIGAGSATIQTSTVGDKQEILFTFKTNKIIDFFYKLKESIIMIVDSNNYSLEYINKESQQGKRIKNHEAYFDYRNNQIYSKNDTTTFKNKLYNPISIISFLKNQKLKMNNQYTFYTYNFGKIKKIGMKVVSEEKVLIKNKQYSCFVLAPFYFNEIDEKNKKGNIKLWISKKEKLPIIIEQTANFGEIILTLNNVQYVK